MAEKLNDLRKRVEPLLLESYVFMDSSVFKRRTIEKELFDTDEEPELPKVSWYQPTREEALTDNLVASEIMKPDKERLMFLRFNFAKRKLNKLQERIRKDGLTREHCEQFLEWHHRFEHIREYLIRTNLALVLAMAKRTRLGDVDFAEIVSEGNMALTRAVDKFNVNRGFKFSTYACRAILKAFSRTTVRHCRHRDRFPYEYNPGMERSDWNDRRRDVVREDCVDELRVIVNQNLANLSSIEMTVIRRRFNWNQEEKDRLTLEEVGQVIGVTKERVRQIQNIALKKIRDVLEESVL